MDLKVFNLDIALYEEGPARCRRDLLEEVNLDSFLLTFGHLFQNVLFFVIH